MALFTKRHGIHHTFVAPYHPSSNGLAERAVQTFKQGIKKLEGTIENRIAQFLFRYRITPHTTTGTSPAELLMGRRLRCELDHLHPDIARRVSEKQDTMIQTRQTPKLRFFKEGERVYAKSFNEKNKWIPATIQSRTGPVSYHIKLSDGRMARRHVDHLRYHYNDNEGEPDPIPQEDSEDWPIVSPSVVATNSTLAPPDNNNNNPITPTPLRRSQRSHRPVNRFTPSSSSN